MKPPLIILGAGASFDLIPESAKDGSEPILPMTDDLLLGKYRDDHIASQYSSIKGIFSRIAPGIRKGTEGASFEDRVMAIADTDQIISLKFYLSDFFDKRSHLLRPYLVNNYHALKDHIAKAGGAHVVSFNYDTVFDHALDISFNKMSEYITGDIKLYKLHGSSDWFHISLKQAHDDSIPDDYSFAKSQPEYQTEYFYTKQMKDELGNEKYNKYFWVPALAIPVAKKQSFICPSEHIKKLEDALPNIEKILVIGWKAKDLPLLDLMKKNIGGNPEVTIVSGTADGAKIIGDRFKSYLPNLVIKETIEGFTKFIGQDCYSFFI